MADELRNDERKLANILQSDPSRVFTKGELMRQIPTLASSRALDACAVRLRMKVGTDHVANIWGVGYRWEAQC